MFYSLIYLLPFLGFLLLNVFGYMLGYNGGIFLSGILSFISLFFSIIILSKFVYDNSIIILNFGVWFTSFNLTVNWEFVFDSLSVFMLLLVNTVSTFVIWYSFNYMYNDPYQLKFLSYIYLFTLFMIILITATDLIVFLVGWEGVGLCSFLLISFWNSRVSACKAALKAIIFNRIGDMGFLIAISIICTYTHSLNFYVLYSFLPFFLKTGLVLYVFNFFILDVIIFFFIGGVLGKSAQLGLHVWLLDAMEGPTPVSALIHAATMVTAGVFLLIRLSFLIEYTYTVKFLIVFLGSLTALSASIMGSAQTDIKSIIAYSTCSQLGYMVALCGVSAYNLSFFHLINHGFFKALLFLSSGVIIHNFLEEQDLRKMGALFQLFPLTYSFFIIGSLSLCGLPFMSGFYSKDLMLEFLSLVPFYWSHLFFCFNSCAIIFTTFYSLKLLYYVFIAQPNGFKNYYRDSYESYSILMLISLILLTLFSIFSGFFFKEFFVGFGSIFFFDTINNLAPINKLFIHLDFFFLQNISLWFNIKLFSFYFIFLGFLVFNLILYFNRIFNLKFIFSNSNKYFFSLYSFIFNGFFFNFLYLNFFFRLFIRSAWFFFFLDKLVFEKIIPYQFLIYFSKLGHIFNTFGKNTRYSDFIFLFFYFFILYIILTALLI